MAHCCDDAFLPPMPLTMTGVGQWVRVAGVCGGCEARERLADMGLLEGSELQVIRSSGGGPMMIGVRGSRLALGRALAQKILVQLLSMAPGAMEEPQTATMSA